MSETESGQAYFENSLPIFRVEYMKRVVDFHVEKLGFDDVSRGGDLKPKNFRVRRNFIWKTRTEYDQVLVGTQPLVVTQRRDYFQVIHSASIFLKSAAPAETTGRPTAAVATKSRKSRMS